MKDFWAGLGQTVCWLVHTVVIITRDNYNKKHRHKLQNGENIARLAIFVILFLFISKALLSSDWRFGLLFFVAGGTAIWFGYVYRGREVVALVLMGTVLGIAAATVGKSALEALSTGDWIGAILILVIAVYLYYISGRLKKGERP